MKINILNIIKKILKNKLFFYFSYLFLILIIVILFLNLNYKNNFINNRNEFINWLAKEYSKIREENEYLKRKIINYDYLIFIEHALKVKYFDFYETINIIYNESIKENLNPYLILAIVGLESNFNSYAKTKCCYGLMQINFNVWSKSKKIFLENIFDKVLNIKFGIEILKYYLKKANDNIYLALLYYNNGENILNNNVNYNYINNVLYSKFYKENEKN